MGQIYFMRIRKPIFRRIGLCLFFGFTSSGCTIFAEFEDISEDARFEISIDQTYTTKVELKIHGVNMETPIAKNIDHFTVTKLPGLGGRELINKNSLDLGTIIRTTKVLRCTNCFLDFKPRLKYQILVLSSDKYSAKPVYIRANAAIIKDGRYVFNPEYFQKSDDGSEP